MAFLIVANRETSYLCNVKRKQSLREKTIQMTLIQ